MALWPAVPKYVRVIILKLTWECVSVFVEGFINPSIHVSVQIQEEHRLMGLFEHERKIKN